MKRLGFALIIPLSVGAHVHAQETQTLEPAVVTATKIEEPVERLGAVVTIITADDLARHNYPTVADALRDVPGVQVQRSGSLGKLTEVRIRGTTPQQVQVLIDGLRVKSPTSGDFDFSDLSPDQIDRIEIVRGPQSTIYGADAIGGVVNIITKRGAGPFSAYASSEVGNYRALRERIGFSGCYQLFDYAASASWFEGSGQLQNDGFGQRAVMSFGSPGIKKMMKQRMAPSASTMKPILRQMSGLTSPYIRLWGTAVPQRGQWVQSAASAFLHCSQIRVPLCLADEAFRRP